MKKIKVLSSIALALLVTISCSEGNPVAPTGTILTMSASPTLIGLQGAAVLTIIGRKPDGNPLSDGTEIRLSTTLGTLPGIVRTDSSGQAIAVLAADGRTGAATVTATTGSGGEGAVEATTMVQVGQTPESRPSLLLSVNPVIVPVEGEANVTVIARSADGSPVPMGQTVILTSTLGTLFPSNPETTSDGTATAILNAGTQAGMATIQAVLGSSDVAMTMLTIRDAAADLSLQPNPTSIPRAGGDIVMVATVLNSQGQPLQGVAVTWRSNSGVFSTTGAVVTNNFGVATTTLTVTEAGLQILLDMGVTDVIVDASTPRADGDDESDRSRIPII